MAGSVILKISHGYSVKDDNDPLVEMAEIAMNNFSLVITPGRFLVDVLPVGRFLVSSTHRGHLKRSASAIPS